MPLQHRFTCPLPNGIHARPASLLVELSRNFDSEITIVNERTGQEANGKSVLSIVSADIRHNDPCVLLVNGPDERDALTKLAAYLDQTFPHCDDALPAAPKSSLKSNLPPTLAGDNLSYYSGIPVVPGVAHGHVVRTGGFQMPATLSTNGVTDPDAEWRLMEEALKKLDEFYGEHLPGARTKVEAAMYQAHRAIAKDPEFRRLLYEAVMRKKRTVAGAIADTQSYFSKLLTESESEVVRERALDVQDVCTQLLRQAYGDAIGGREIHLSIDSIVIAESLTPTQFLALDTRFLKGLVLAHAGATSHTIILARSFDVPTLAGVIAAGSPQLEGHEAVLDALAGVLVTNLTVRARRYYELERQRLDDRRAFEKKFSDEPGATKDGRRIEIAANIAGADEAAPAFAAGAESVGLFRTEMLFLDRKSAPSEAEQFEAYSQVLKAATGRAVIIRTLDVGGDKPLDYLKLPVEENPFLGYRGIRIYPKLEGLFRSQIRALLLASAQGQLKILIPMAATVEEVRWVRQIIAEEQKKCSNEGIPFDPMVPIGAMIEVPAAAFSLEHLCQELDFFSLGTNDLLQYFMAADRTNASVAQLYRPTQPAFLRMLKQIVDEVHLHKKWIGLCGEMGGQVRLLPLLVGLGLDEISVAIPAIVKLKAELAKLTSPECRRLLDESLKCDTVEEVEMILNQAGTLSKASLLEPELILVQQQAATKAEAVKLAADRLYVLGRTNNSRELEEAIWEREQTYSTGFGHGFAIPHGKTDAVRFNSLVVVKLKTPVDWNALDGKPVEVIILLALRGSDAATAHMKVLARLARKVMDETFRARLEEENDSHALYDFLKTNLNIE